MQGQSLRTARLVLRPVNWADMEDMARLKADIGAFGGMLGGVRNCVQAEEEMAADIALWARRGVGIFTISEQNCFIGMTGVHERPDGRGLGLRIALFPRVAGRGLAREAAGCALYYTLGAGEERVIAVTREDNLASRIVLGGIGMILVETFQRDGHNMLLYEKRRRQQFRW